MLRQQRLPSLRGEEISTARRITFQITASSITASRSTVQETHPPPPPPPPLHLFSYHPVRSRRWFFGRSCRSRRSRASATLHPSPPSLHTPTHTVPSSSAFTPSPCSSIIQAFARTHACARTPTPHIRTYSIDRHTHTHTEEGGKCWCRGSCCWSTSSPLQWSDKEAASD